MADLDDFFKKKDKKKKGEKKFAKANTDVLAKNLEVMDEKEEKALVKEIAEMNNDNPGTTLNQQDDDEWDDYRENKKDYTGLKIENLTVQETKTEEEEEEETEVDEDGEVVKKNKDGSGPWNRGEGSHQNSVEEREEVMPELHTNAEGVACCTPPTARAPPARCPPAGSQLCESGLHPRAARAEEEGTVPPLVIEEDGEGGLTGAWV